MKYTILVLVAISFVITLFQANSDVASALTPEEPDSCYPQVVSDNDGGVYVAFLNEESEILIIQHLNSDGKPEWVKTDIIEPTIFSFRIICDSKGDAFIIWRGNIGNISGLYIQKINNKGDALWKEEGILLQRQRQRLDPYGRIQNLEAITDNAGGVILVWQIRDNDRPLYAQRINEYGEIVWDNGGIQIALNVWRNIDVISDGSDGVIISWQEYSTGSFYAMRLNMEGEPLWESEKIKIGNDSSYAVLLPDGNHGMIVFFYNYPRHSILHIDQDGITTWNFENVAEMSGAWDIGIRQDGMGGAIFVYRKESQPTYETDLYASKLDNSGKFVWTIHLSDSSYYQSNPKLISVGTENHIITWIKYHSKTQYLYMQKVNFSGSVLWNKDGANIGELYQPARDYFVVPIEEEGIIIVGEEGKFHEPVIFSISVDKSGVITQNDEALYPTGVQRTYKDYPSGDNIQSLVTISLIMIVCLPVIIISAILLYRFSKKRNYMQHGGSS